MRIGVYQFASGGEVGNNLKTILGAVKQGAARGVNLLVFHECALCGYPPLETTIEQIDQKQGELEKALDAVAQAAWEYRLYIAVGTVRHEEERRYNSVILFNDLGIRLGHYDKTALWGWDLEHFTRGSAPGVFEIEGVKVGFRICFDVRFPESFRQLYRGGVELCCVSFSDTGEKENLERYDILKGHLSTRAVENVMTVVAVNSISRHQTAPTGIFDANGRLLLEAARNREELLVYDYQSPERTFGLEGRIVNNSYFLGDTGWE